MSSMAKSQILILSSAESEETRAINDGFVQELNKQLGTDGCVRWCNYHEIGLELQNGKLEAFIIDGRVPLSGFKAVYFKSYFRYVEQATAIAETLIASNTRFIGAELKEYIPAHKLSQMARLARGGVHIPHTVYLPLEHYPKHYDELTKKFGKTFIFKATDGSTGEDNYLVTSRQQLTKIVAENEGRHFIAQRFVPNDSDLRVLIVGGVIRLVIERRRQDDSTHLNNTSQGASARLLPLEDLRPEHQEVALYSASLMQRDVAGVDLMLEQGTGMPYVLEVNASPQIASGAFMGEKLSFYADYFKGLML